MLKEQRLHCHSNKEISILLENKLVNDKNKKIFELQKDDNVCLYYFDNDPEDVDILALPVVSLWSVWNNYIIADSWKYAEFISNITTNNTKIFYIIDIDWHKQILTYDQQLKIINKMDKVICRNKTDAKLINHRYGISPDVMSEYNLKSLKKILENN